jgi:antitoxin YefM
MPWRTCALGFEARRRPLETLHLLGAPANANRLSESIAEFNAGKTAVRGLIDEPAEEESAKNGCSR